MTRHRQIDKHLLFLSDAIDTIGCLIFLCRIPCAAKMNHVIRRRNGKANACCLGREDKHTESNGGVELIDDLLPCRAVHVTVDGRMDANAKFLLQQML